MSVASTFSAIQRSLDIPGSSRWRGPCAPFVRQPLGYFESSGTRSVILSSIINILETPLESRLMLPDFGSRLGELVFEPNDELLAALARVYIAEALERWEPRMRLVSVDVFRDQFREDVLVVRIVYMILEDSLQETATLRVGPAGASIMVESVG